MNSTRRPPAQSPAEKPLRAAIYCRISDDAESREKGVDRQQEDCRRLADRLGLDVVVEYVENDVSASTASSKPRPKYVEMQRAARTGEIDVILAYSLSRLTRRVREFLDLIDLYRETGVTIKTCVSGDPDLSTADGRGSAINLANWDQMEAERTSERARRAKEQRAADGLYRGGKRPYGFERDGMTVREDEAAVIRDATAALLAGRSLRAVCRELNEADRRPRRDRKVRETREDGLPGPFVRDDRGEILRETYSVDWAPTPLRDVLLRARNAGLIGSGKPGREEILGEARWPALVDQDTWRALAALLNDSRRRTNSGVRENKWLGSYIYTCGLCGSIMRADSTNRAGQAKRIHYRCNAAAHLQITQGRTDDAVRAVLRRLLSNPRVIAAMTPDNSEMVSADRERRTALEERLRQTDADYFEDLIDARTRKEKREHLEAQMAEVDARLNAALSGVATSEVARASDPAAAFDAAPLDVQRAVLAQVLRVEVHPATKRGMWWSPERLHLTPAVEGADVEAPDPDPTEEPDAA